MKLNPNAWHARWYATWSGNRFVPTDLCSYVWWFVRFVMVWSLVVLAVVLGAVAFYQSWPVSGYVTLCVMTTLFLLGFLLWGMNQESWFLFQEYLKARKEKYCPRIEWEDYHDD